MRETPCMLMHVRTHIMRVHAKCCASLRSLHLFLLNSRCCRRWSPGVKCTARLQVYSCVLFLGRGGGPTAVLAQRGGGGPAPGAWLVTPRTGRLAVFDGTLLHGVIPGGRPHCQGCLPHCSPESATSLMRACVLSPLTLTWRWRAVGRRTGGRC